MFISRSFAANHGCWHGRFAILLLGTEDSSLVSGNLALRTSRYLAALLATSGLSWTTAGRAAETDASPVPPSEADSQVQLPGENASGLPGVIRMPLPTPETAPVVVAASAGVGLYNRYLGLQGGSQKWFGTIAASWSPIRYLSLRGQLSGSVDDAADPAQSPTAYGEPSLAARGLYPVMPSLHLGLEAELRMVGGVAPDVNPGAWSPALRALGAYQVGAQTWLAADVGFRLDNSAEALNDAIADNRRVDDGNRLLSGASSFSQVELGLGASHRLSQFELLGEFTLNALVGSGAPSLAQSPMSIALGTRYHYSESLVFRGHLEASPSALPSSLAPDTYVPIRPRFAIGIGAQWRFGASVEKPRTKPVAEVVEKPKLVEKKPDSGRVIGRTVDEGGRPIPDVKVTLVREGAPPLEYFTDADGRYEFTEVPFGTAQLTTETPGFDPVEREVTINSSSAEVPESVLYESVPGGQLRGKVLNLRGEAVRAEITIMPGDQRIEVGADGFFTVDLAPGTYRVQFKHPGHRTQMRHIRVQDKGVVVVNIALEK